MNFFLTSICHFLSHIYFKKHKTNCPNGACYHPDISHRKSPFPFLSRARGTSALPCAERISSALPTAWHGRDAHCSGAHSFWMCSGGTGISPPSLLEKSKQPETAVPAPEDSWESHSYGARPVIRVAANFPLLRVHVLTTRSVMSLTGTRPIKPQASCQISIKITYISNDQGDVSPNYNEIPPNTHRDVSYRKQTNRKWWVWWRWGGTGTLVHCGWAGEMLQLRWKTVGQFLKKLKMESPYNSISK